MLFDEVTTPSELPIYFLRSTPDRAWASHPAGNATCREHLFRHCSRWKDQQKTLWKEVGKATGWRAGRCRHVKVSELLSIEKCDQAVMDFVAATDVGKFPPKMDGEGRAGGQRAEEWEPAGYGWRNKSLRTFLDFISFPLYYNISSRILFSVYACLSNSLKSLYLQYLFFVYFFWDSNRSLRTFAVIIE